MVNCIKLISIIYKIESAKNLIEKDLQKKYYNKKNNKFMIIDIDFISNIRFYKYNIWNYNSA